MTILELGEEHALPSEFNVNIELDHSFHKEAVYDIRSNEVVSELLLSI